MLTGALVQLMQAGVYAADRAGIAVRTNDLARTYKGHALADSELQHATNQAYWFTVGSSLTFALTWCVLAQTVWRGRHFGRVVATVLALVYVFTFVFSGMGTLSLSTFLSVMLCIIAIMMVYLLWRRSVTAWMTTSRVPAASDEPSKLG